MDLSKLPDIREANRDAAAQEVALIREAPITPPHHINSANLQHVALMVVRFLNRHLSPESRLAGTNPDAERGAAIAEQEKKNPMLRLAWSHLGVDSVAKEALSAALERVRVTAAEPKMYEGQNAHLLLESDEMLTTLLGRDPFLLYHPAVLTQPLDEEPATGPWVITGEDLTPLYRAKNSLLKWEPKKSTLSEFVEAKIGMFEINTKQKNNNRRLWYRFNQPAIMRVQFSVGSNDMDTFATDEEREARISHRVLREFKMGDDSQWDVTTTDDGEVRVSALPAAKLKYTLVMVVRHGDQRFNSQAFLRRYHLNGTMIDEPATFLYANPNWRLDDKEGKYHLYYCRNPDISSFEGRARPEVPVSFPQEPGTREYVERAVRYFDPGPGPSEAYPESEEGGSEDTASAASEEPLSDGEDEDEQMEDEE